jgi:creatinine amidohydrolase
MNFPGTITLRHETFDALIYDIVSSLREHGLKQFFFINGHGGNAPNLNVMIVRLRHELGVHVAWSGPTSLASDVTKILLTPDNNGHCSQGETSQAMYLAPQVVRRDRIVPGSTKGYPYKFVGKGNGINVPYMWDELTDNGALGDATLASEEIGKKIIDAALNKATEFLIDFMDKNTKK